MSYNSQNMPVVGAEFTLILPRNSPQSVDTQDLPIIVPLSAGKHAALFISTCCPLNVWLCTGVLANPGIFDVADGAEVWLFAINGPTRIIVPAQIQFAGFDAPLGVPLDHYHFSYWLEDKIPVLSRPCPFMPSGG